MATYAVGRLIKKIREEKKITQEELSFGICSTVTLSKLENGQQSPRKEHFEALMQRLGYSADNFFSAFLSDEEYAGYEQMEQLKFLLSHNEFEQASEYIQGLEGSSIFTKGQNRQFLLSSKATLLFAQEQLPKDELLELLNIAIRITIPEFTEEKIGTYMLAFQEIVLINMLSAAYYQTGEKVRAIQLLYELKASMDSSYVDETEKARNYPKIVYNLLRCLFFEKRFDEAVLLFDGAKRFCIRNKVIDMLPYIAYLQAGTYYELGNTKPCRDLLRQTYYTLMLMERFAEANAVKKDALKDYSIRI